MEHVSSTSFVFFTLLVCPFDHNDELNKFQGLTKEVLQYLFRNDFDLEKHKSQFKNVFSTGRVCVTTDEIW